MELGRLVVLALRTNLDLLSARIYLQQIPATTWDYLFGTSDMSPEFEKSVENLGKSSKLLETESKKFLSEIEQSKIVLNSDSRTLLQEFVKILVQLQKGLENLAAEHKALR